MMSELGSSGLQRLLYVYVYNTGHTQSYRNIGCAAGMMIVYGYSEPLGGEVMR